VGVDGGFGEGLRVEVGGGIGLGVFEPIGGEQTVVQLLSQRPGPELHEGNVITKGDVSNFGGSYGSERKYLSELWPLSPPRLRD